MKTSTLTSDLHPCTCLPHKRFKWKNNDMPNIFKGKNSRKNSTCKNWLIMHSTKININGI